MVPLQNGTFQSVAPIITVSSFSFPLTFFYFALATLAAISIGRVLYFKHKFLSFQGGFLTLSLVWSLLRAVLLLFTDLVRIHAPNVFRLLLWLPEVFQLATFSLMVIFYGSILHPQAKRIYIVAYAVLNSLFLVIHVLIYALIVSHVLGVPLYTEAVVDALSFACLAILLGFFGGWLVLRLGDATRGTPTLASLGRRSSRFKTALFVGFVVAILVSRAIVELLLALGVVDFAAFRASAGFSWQGGMWFMAYIAWEVIPILIFIISYWPASSSTLLHPSSLAGYSSVDDMSVNADPPDPKGPRKKPISINREAEPLVASNLFSNTARYDSDGEEGNFETASGSLYSPYTTSSPKLKVGNIGYLDRKFRDLDKK